VLAVLVNPRALRHRQDRGTTRRLERLLQGRGLLAETRTLEHLERVARALRADGVDHVAVSGGDGTLGTTLSALRRAWGGAPLPEITPLRGGTMNTISNGLGMPRRSPEQLLAALLEGRARRGPLHTERRATMVVDDHRVTFLFGVGVAYGFLAEYYDAGASRPGPVVAAGTLARLAGSALVDGPIWRRAANRTPVSVRFVHAGSDPAPSPAPGAAGAWPVQPYLGVLAGTVDAVGLGFRPFHLLTPGLRAFHLLGLAGPASRIVRRLPRVRRGEPLGPDAALDAAVAAATIDLETGEDVRWFADGDLGRSRGGARLALGPDVTFVWPEQR